MTSEQLETSSDHDRTVTIIVNARAKQTSEKRLTFEQIVSLAYDGNPPSGSNWEFTVTYSKGDEPKKEGSLLPGEDVKVKDGMVFNVTATDKS